MTHDNDSTPDSGGASPVDPDLINDIDAVVWEFDPRSSRFTYVSGGAELLLGYPARRWLDEPAFWQGVVVHPADLPRVQKFLGRVAEHGGRERVRFRARRSTGGSVWLRTIAHGVYDDDGAVRLLRGAMFDITHRMRIERALRASEARHRRLVETSPYAIYEIDTAGIFVQVNSAAAELLARTTTEIIGMDFREIVPADELPAAESALGALVSRAASVVELELHVVRPSGERRLVSLRATIVEQRGRIVGSNGIARDITEERERDEALRRAERLAGLGTLIGGVAHELNNPLQAISAFAEMLVDEIDDPELCSRADLIQREAERASRIVSSLRRLARDTQKTSERTLVDVNDVVRHVLQIRSYTLQTANIAVVEQLEPVLPPVMASRGELEQVLLNLVVNAEQALTASDSDRILTVSTRRERGSVVASVKDSGPGIPRDQLGRIFDPFYTTKSPGDGTGLGLSLAHSIVTEHGGALRVRSAPGSGATFIVRLPDAEITEGPVTPDTGQAAPPGRALSVLIVDDESAIRDVLASFLRRRGHLVDTAAEGAAALAAVSARTPDTMFDVILSDLRMPGLGGDELMRRLRAIDPALLERVILMTGDAASDETVATLAQAGVPVIVKPFTLAELAELVENR